MITLHATQETNALGIIANIYHNNQMAIKLTHIMFSAIQILQSVLVITELYINWEIQSKNAQHEISNAHEPSYPVCAYLFKRSYFCFSKDSIYGM